MQDGVNLLLCGGTRLQDDTLEGQILTGQGMVQVNCDLIVCDVGYCSVECLLTVAKRYDGANLYVLVIEYAVAKENAFVQVKYVLLAVLSVCLV